MRIGYVRMCGSIQLDYAKGTATGLEDRICLIKSLVKLGHTVIVYSAMARHEKKLFESKEVFSGYLEFLNGVFYRPEGFPDKDKCRFLIVEVGTTNMMFSTGGKPHIRRMLEVVDSFFGVVIWNQTDVLLPIPFWQMAKTKYPWGHKKNGYNNPKYRGDGWTIDSGWGTYDEVFGKDKINVVAGKTNDVDQFISMMSKSGRCRYNAFDKLRYAYYPSFIDQTLRDARFDTVCKKSKWDLIYCGWQKRRKKDFDKFVMGYTLGKVAVFGKWPDKTIEQYPNVNWGGFLKYFWQIDKRIHNSLCSIQIGENATIALRWMTLRPFEIITDRSIVLCDSRLFDKYSYPFIGVKNADEVRRAIRRIRRMAFKERERLNERMMDGIKPRLMKYAGKKMIGIYELYEKIGKKEKGIKKGNE